MADGTTPYVNGVYTYEIEAVDFAGVKETHTGTVTIIIPTPEITEHSALPNPFILKQAN